MDKLFTPFKLGAIELANRVVMAPMTRARISNTADAADEMTAQYYRQRASAGLIITEGSQISQQGQGFLFIPGIYSDAQVEGWRLTTQAVHEQNGKIFIQIWHVGRMSHTGLQPNGAAPVSSVAKRSEGGTCFARDEHGEPGKIPVSEPHQLTIAEIDAIKNDYVAAARNAMKAGFDGVEIHGANGYLLEQFINGELNTRNDQYGGPDIDNRLRFVLEVVDAVASAIGAERTGIRLSPFGRLFDMHGFEGEEETWLQLAKELTNRGLAYVHLSDQKTIGAQAIPDGFIDRFRATYNGALIIAGGFDKQKAESYLQEGKVDLVGFGSPYIANPDLVERMQHDWPIAIPERATYYGGDEHGYIDYPTYQDEQG